VTQMPNMHQGCFHVFECALDRARGIQRVMTGITKQLAPARCAEGG
jgi:hypothetical protein